VGRIEQRSAAGGALRARQVNAGRASMSSMTGFGRILASAGVSATTEGTGGFADKKAHLVGGERIGARILIGEPVGLRHGEIRVLSGPLASPAFKAVAASIKTQHAGIVFALDIEPFSTHMRHLVAHH